MAYKCHAFVDFREVSDAPAGIARWAKVCQTLNGAGVPSVSDVLNEMFAPPPVVELPVEEKKPKKKKSAPKKPAEKKEKTEKKPTIRKTKKEATPKIE